VTSVRSDFQKIDIYDSFYRELQLSKESALKTDPTYMKLHPELFRPDRILFLDDVTQSTREGDAAYHESLTHPSLFSHDNPKRVAIIGGGEGATLREVLKHNTVEKVVMIEIDQLIMDVSRHHLPEWIDCSNLVGSSSCCFDDPRAEIYAEDAFQWFIDRYEEDTGALPFDIIIMDAL
jgi:spermidine synthase